jgi:hypothetical protein
MDLKKIDFTQILVLWACLAIGFFSCKKDPALLKDRNANLKFSNDTVLFDTVFTRVGSVTKQLKVYNPFKQKVLISNIFLAGGNNSQFRLNIDGVPGNFASDVEIMPNDSLFIFVEVTVNPNNTNAPLVVSDSIMFDWNGKTQHVELVAWGQDAHYILANRYIPGFPAFRIIAGQDTSVRWTNDKPYVVYGYAVVDSAACLVVDPGVRIHFHKNSGMWIYRYGCIQVNGTKEQPVTFQGDRLDNDYRYIAGQWDRIWINEGAKSSFNYAIIKNGFVGIQAETIVGIEPADQTELVLNNTQISSMSGFGILSIFYKIRSANTIITECQEQTLAILLGGSYSFRHCTFANYWNGTNRKSPSLIINNYNDQQTLSLDSAYFGNCIITGNYTNEISLDLKSGSSPNYWFDHCLVKVDNTVNTDDPARFINIVKNPADVLIDGVPKNPLFKDVSLNNYHLITASAASNKGNNIISQQVPYDLDNVLRSDPPDLGCYEEN